MDPAGAGGHDVLALARGPVLVVADGEERPVAQQGCARAVDVDAGAVLHVEAVGFEEADHRVLRGEEVVETPLGAARHERAVVADRERSPDAVQRVAGRPGIRVQAPPAPRVVGLPGRVGGLKEDVGGTVVAAHDEGHVVRADDAVIADELGEIDARDRVGRYVPRGRDRPVPAVQKPAAGDVHRPRLCLRKRGRRLHGGDVASAEALVEPEPVDVEVIRGGRRGDLERHRGPAIDADLRRESLDAGVPGSPPVARAVLEVPRRARGPRQRVLGHHVIHRGPLLESEAASS